MENRGRGSSRCEFRHRSGDFVVVVVLVGDATSRNSDPGSHIERFIPPPTAAHALRIFIAGRLCLFPLSYGRGIRKGTQGSVLAWRAASLLLGRLLLLY